MTLSDIERALNEPTFSVTKCSRDTGLHINTLYRIKQGKATKPNPLTLEALEKYLKKIGA